MSTTVTLSSLLRSIRDQTSTRWQLQRDLRAACEDALREPEPEAAQPQQQQPQQQQALASPPTTASEEAVTEQTSEPPSDSVQPEATLVEAPVEQQAEQASPLDATSEPSEPSEPSVPAESAESTQSVQDSPPDPASAPVPVTTEAPASTEPSSEPSSEVPAATTASIPAPLPLVEVPVEVIDDRLTRSWSTICRALDPELPLAIRETALVGLQRLFASNQAFGAWDPSTLAPSTTPSTLRLSFSDSNNLAYLDSLSGNQPQLIVDDVCSRVCGLYNGSSTESSIQLQIIRFLLTLGTSTTSTSTIGLHGTESSVISSFVPVIRGTSLVKAVVTCANMALFAGELQNQQAIVQSTARAALLQLVNGTVARISPTVVASDEDNSDSLALLRLFSDLAVEPFPRQPPQQSADAASKSSPKQVSSEAYAGTAVESQARALALELCLSMLTNGGLPLCTSLQCIAVVRKHVCVALSRNGLSSDPTIFEIALSLFLILLSHFRAPLKAEIELLFNGIYLRVLESPQTPFKQKTLVVQGLTKMCKQPQLLVDVYVNYDCDLNMASIFERVVNAVARIAQGKARGVSVSASGSAHDVSSGMAAGEGSVIGSTLSGLIGSHAAGLLLDSGSDLALVQDRRLMLRGLRCLVSMVESLRAWAADNDASGDEPTDTDAAIEESSGRPSTASDSISITPSIEATEPPSESPETSRPSTSMAMRRSTSIRNQRPGSAAGGDTGSIHLARSRSVHATSNATSAAGQDVLPVSSSPVVLMSRRYLNAIDLQDNGEAAAALIARSSSPALGAAAVVDGSGAGVAASSAAAGSNGNADESTAVASYVTLKEIETVAKRKMEFTKGVSLFARNPKKGLAYFESHGFLIIPSHDDTLHQQQQQSVVSTASTAPASTADVASTGEDDVTVPRPARQLPVRAIEVAKFLHTTPQLSKAAIGDYLGESDQINIDVMHAFIDMLDFSELEFVSALRKFVRSFRLPGEAQKIDRIMEKFADRYCEQNPSAQFTSADVAYLLAFSLIMLNTDQHSNQVKNRMNKAAFIKSNRLIFSVEDMPDKRLEAYFDDVASSEIVMERTGLPTNSSSTEEDSLHTNLLRMLEGQRPSAMASMFRIASDAAAHIGPMFRVAWAPLLATFSTVFEGSNEENSATDGVEFTREKIKLCLNGTVTAVQVAGINRMDTERMSLISALANMTGLRQLASASNDSQSMSFVLRRKNVDAIHSMIQLATTHGEYLDASWAIVLDMVSQMDRLGLLGESALLPPPPPFNSSVNASIDSTRSQSATPGNKRASISSAVSFNELGSRATSPVASTSSPLMSPAALARNPALRALISELQSQSTIVAIDHIYTRSADLSPSSVLFFIQALCQIATKEVLSRHRPRLHALQKIVEVTHYNMRRIRFEWAQIWAVLLPFFAKIGTNPTSPTGVVAFAIDSLRQLALKFLERDELDRFDTQQEFLTPFEHIAQSTNHDSIYALIIESLLQMCNSRSKTLRSGWRIMLRIFGMAATTTSNTTTSDDDAAVPVRSDALALSTARSLEHIVSTSLELMAPYTPDLVQTVVAFALREPVDPATTLASSDSEPIAEIALRILTKCAEHALTHGRSSSSSASAAASAIRSPPMSPRHAQHQQHQSPDEHIVAQWVPIFRGFCRIASGTHQREIRMRSLRTVFRYLGREAERMSPESWVLVFHQVFSPLMTGIEDVSATEPPAVVAETVWMAMLPLVSNLVTNHTEALLSTSNVPLPGSRGLANGTELAQNVTSPLDCLMSLLDRYVRAKHRVLSHAGLSTLTGIIVDICVNDSEHDGQADDGDDVLQLSDAVWNKFGALLNTALMVTRPWELFVLGRDLFWQRIHNSSSLSATEPLFGNVVRRLIPVEVLTGCEVNADDGDVTKLVDFDYALVKCGLHLTAVHAIRTLAFPLSSRIEQQHQEQKQSSPIKELSSSQYLSQNLLLTAPRSVMLSCLNSLRDSYLFAREFNINTELRQHLRDKEYVKQTPNLLAQETLARTVLFEVGFSLYASLGDVDFGTGPSSEIVPWLLHDAQRLLASYGDMLKSPDQHSRELGYLTDLVVVVLKQLVLVPWYSDETNGRFDAMREAVPDLATVAVKLVASDNARIRAQVQEFLAKVMPYVKISI
ncbi:hypothetical protein GQ42DRAFT_161307 [Ramicandelaber brevisporus]|nr:hypothetical protein GQ42DRAFT_161307 [Ramicandelaber brevisporus]